MKIAITTDWLTTPGGAERVIAEMMKTWPEADLFTTVYNKKKCPLFDKRATKNEKLVTSSLQTPYNILHDHRPLLPLMPRAVESWDLRGFDVVLSSSHAVAKGCIPPATAKHICYCHTPMRYAWLMEEEYLSDFGVKGPLKWIAKRELEKLRRWDLTTSKRVDQFIANSSATQKRIKEIYGRDSIVLHPPVDDRFFEVNLRPVDLSTCRPVGSAGQQVSRSAGQDYFLMVGRLVPYKRFDLAIEACNALKLSLKIAGTGSEEKKLRKLAGPTIEFLGRVEDEALPELYANARALIFPVHEDAGIVPLEAQACGTPVIALKKGGTLDTVLGSAGSLPAKKQTGLFFEEQTVDSLIEALKQFEGLTFDSKVIREHAKKFLGEKFQNSLKSIIESVCT